MTTKLEEANVGKSESGLCRSNSAMADLNKVTRAKRNKGKKFRIGIAATTYFRCDGTYMLGAVESEMKSYWSEGQK